VTSAVGSTIGVVRRGSINCSPETRDDVKKLKNDDGSATAEYAIATMAAVGFAGLLVVIMKSDEVRGILTDLVRSALSFGG
jgi:hypothetical protein